MNAWNDGKYELETIYKGERQNMSAWHDGKYEPLHFFL